jgi:anti-sigma factor RsiW
MSKCRELEPLLTSYIDGEATSSARASVEAHLERCPRCRHRVAGERAAREVLVAHRGGLRTCASEHLRAKCAAHRLRRSGLAALRARSWVPLMVAATVVLALAGAVVVGLSDNVEALSAQLTLEHMRCFHFAPERLAHTDAATAARDWAAGQGWTLQVPESSQPAQLELLGVRKCTTASGRPAHVLYRWHGQPLSMFVLRHTLDPRAPVDAVVKTFGHGAVIWSGRDRTYIVLARGEPADLRPIVSYMKTQAR